ncbi:MAG: competence/damage-inducible protein A [Candidatus Kapabacteria bacterium]|nr:competence/damage-inducible protein A [Candidatus Kapabacteria bacterium]
MVNVSILTIGDEICIGQIVNTNSAYIASKCTSIGLNVLLHSTVPDKKELMLAELERLAKISDIVIITGGLGPTEDDITKPTLCEFLNDKLEFHQPTFEYLKNWFSSRGREMNELHKTQAMLPTKCKALRNMFGTAPGMLFEENGKVFISLPGVPKEMKFIIEDSVIPFLKNFLNQKNSDLVLYKTIHTAGIFESDLAILIGSKSDFPEDCSFAYLPSYKGVRLRIGVNSKTFEEGKEKIEKIEKYLMKKISKYVVGTDSDDLVLTVSNILRQKKMTVAVAESCTGGLLGANFTNYSGSSDIFLGGIIAYSNEIKIDILGVEKATIESFGAVSEQTALEMAKNIKDKFRADFGISITGIAGPTGGTSEKPVGTVWIGLADNKKSIAKKFLFGDDREINRERSVAAALTMLFEKLNEFEK